MENFEQDLRQHVHGLTDLDVGRIMAAAYSDYGKTLQAIADDLDPAFAATRDGLNYSLGKVYKSPDAPGINSLKDLRDWVRGLLENPFRDGIIVVDRYPHRTRTDKLVFGCGSINDPGNLARTTGQDPSSFEYLPAQLSNHVLEWSAQSHRLNYSDAQWKSTDDVLWLWLGIRRTGNPTDVVDGALVKLNGVQYRQVRARESHYNEVNVSDDILVDGRPANFLSPLIENEIIAFAPDPSKQSENQTGGRTAVRAGYYQGILEHLDKLHPGKGVRLPELPPGVELLEAYPTDDRVADEYWKNISKVRLDGYHDSLDKELYRNDVVRRPSGGTVTIPFIMKGMMLNRRTYEKVMKAAESAVSVSVKSHRLVLEDPRLFELNQYTDVDRRLADSGLANNGTDLPVVTRVDLTLRGDRLTVFEVNSDSPAGAHHLDELTKRQWDRMESRELTGDLVEVVEPPSTEGVCDSIVAAFERGWDAYLERKSDPRMPRKPRRIAIVDADVHAQASYTEFEHFQKLLLKRIYGRDLDKTKEADAHEVVILDVEDLRYREDHKELVDNLDRPIDAVYKRLLWQDANTIGMGGLSTPLCRAYQDDSVFVMNSFRSRLVGSKLNLAIAKSPSFEARCNDIGIDLTDDERDVLENNIPETHLWAPISLDDRDPEELKAYVMADVTNWVLKVYHGKGGQDFIPGAPSHDVPARESFLRSWQAGDHIAQRHQEHGMASVPVLGDWPQGIVWHRYPFILGAYVIDGKCVALEAKVDSTIPINVGRGGRRTAVFSLKE